MASIYRPTYVRNGRRRKSDTWYLEFRDHAGTRRRLAAFTDRRASAELGRKLELLVARRAAGQPVGAELSAWVERTPLHLRKRLAAWDLLDRKHLAAAAPLRDLLEDFRAHLQAKECTGKHIKQKVARAERVLVHGCGFRSWTEIDPSKVERYLLEERERKTRPIGRETSNKLLQACTQFARWMVRTGKATEDPLRVLRRMNVATDVRRRRRALTQEETVKLLAKAEQGAEVQGVSGTERSLLYRLALETGLRASELRSLTAGSFDLTREGAATVTVEAAHSKHRREDTLPLREGIARLLATHLASKMPQAPVFRLPKHWRSAEMLKGDLAAAGIEYRDVSDRVADFHALRHTFITNVCRSGVQPKVAQRLARHSTITMTLGHYTHLEAGDERRALEALPELGAAAAERNAARQGAVPEESHPDPRPDEGRASAP